MPFNVAVIYGSVRTHRKGIRVARFLVKKLEERGHNVTFVDPLEYKLPFLDKMYKEFEPGTAPEIMEKLSKILAGADGFVFVSAEYNHSVPAALKNLIDHFQKEYFFKPAAIASYSSGAFGGTRAAIHLRSILGELGMVSTPSFFTVPKIEGAFGEEGEPADKEAQERRVKKFLDEFEWYLAALKEPRKTGTPY